MAFSDPVQILHAIGLHEGQTVADLGSGSGFYSLAAAKIVGGGGTVYSIDVQQDLLSRLKNFARTARTNNIHVLHGNMEIPGGISIAQNTVDIALACNVLFQIEHKDTFVQEIQRILKPGGRVLVVDWIDSGGVGPTSALLISEKQSRELFEKFGFVFITTIPAGDHHYGMSLRKV